jgi:hypothetical protein
VGAGIYSVGRWGYSKKIKKVCRNSQKSEKVVFRGYWVFELPHTLKLRLWSMEKRAKDIPQDLN